MATIMIVSIILYHPRPNVGNRRANVDFTIPILQTKLMICHSPLAIDSSRRIWESKHSPCLCYANERLKRSIFASMGTTICVRLMRTTASNGYRRFLSQEV